VNREKVNILLVDDQPAKLLSYESILGELGENLIRAASGREALDRLLKTDVAVLLADVNMPDLDGFELASMIRQHPRFQKLAILFVSAVHLTDSDRLKGYQLGAADYVTVPVIPEILRAKVSVFVDLYRKTRELENVNSQLESRVEERAAALAASEERFRLAMEAVRGGLYDWTIETNAWWRSAGLAALLGSSGEPDCPSYEWWRSRIHADDVEGGWKDVRSALDIATPAFDVQYRVRHHKGHWIWVWDRGRIVRDVDGRVIRVVGHVTDVNAQKEAEDALKQANDRKNEFLAMLSHELRNPLAPIRNAVNVLRIEGSSQAEIQKGRDIIDRQVDHLSRILNDLLDVNRITRNKIELQMCPLNLAEAIQPAIEASNGRFAQHGPSLHVSIPESIHVRGDAIRLTQVFTNLLNNSAQYTPAGGEVWLSAEVEGEVAVIRVRDTGKGIAQEKLPHVFQMFYQDTDTAPYVHEGLGIGLTLVARIVELHGGTVQVTSAGLTAGSEFTVRLPALLDWVAPDRSEQALATNGKGTRAVRRVLIADDNEDCAESLAMLLRLKGYDVRTVSDGPQAIQMASQFLPEAVLLDIGMPTLNGYDVARMMREEPWGKHLLMIAQTGWGQARDRQRSQEAGFDAHLTKPVDCAALMELLCSSPGGKHGPGDGG
jgi:signal transduction histidine kinase/DNA-binding response OmpR family regulator